MVYMEPQFVNATQMCRSSIVSTKGLLNGPGQNNCFLNCAVQVSSFHRLYNYFLIDIVKRRYKGIYLSMVVCSIHFTWYILIDFILIMQKKTWTEPYVYLDEQYLSSLYFSFLMPLKQCHEYSKFKFLLELIKSSSIKCMYFSFNFSSKYAWYFLSRILEKKCNYLMWFCRNVVCFPIQLVPITDYTDIMDSTLVLHFVFVSVHWDDNKMFSSCFIASIFIKIVYALIIDTIGLWVWFLPFF